MEGFLVNLWLTARLYMCRRGLPEACQKVAATGLRAKVLREIGAMALPK